MTIMMMMRRWKTSFLGGSQPPSGHLFFLGCVQYYLLRIEQEHHYSVIQFYRLFGIRRYIYTEYN